MELNTFNTYFNKVNTLHSNFSQIISPQNRKTFEKIVKLKNEFEEVHIEFIKDFNNFENLGIKMELNQFGINFFVNEAHLTYSFKNTAKISTPNELSISSLNLISKISSFFNSNSLQNIAKYYLELEHLSDLYEKNILNRKSKKFSEKVDYIKKYCRELQSPSIVEEAYKNKDQYIFLSFEMNKRYENFSLKKYTFKKDVNPDFNKLFALKKQKYENFIDYQNEPLLEQLVFKDKKSHYWQNYEINTHILYDKLNIKTQLANF